jgi:hypothetical protein
MLPISGVLDILCPRCGERATFDEAFEFLTRRSPIDPATVAGLHRWGGWYVREKYPSIMPWVAPSGSDQFLYAGPEKLTEGFRLRDQGVVRCSRCHLVSPHVLRWPRDAYFQWNVRGQRLWAFDAENARVLLHYIESVQRAPARYHGYRRSLERLPAVVLSAKNRSEVVRKIRASLEAAGEQSHTPSSLAIPHSDQPRTQPKPGARAGARDGD